MPQSRDCPKCAGGMETGFTADNGDYGSKTVTAWIEGEPVKSIWVGLKLKGRKRLAIATWRCRRCGYLESYAPE